MTNSTTHTTSSWPLAKAIVLIAGVALVACVFVPERAPELFAFASMAIALLVSTRTVLNGIQHQLNSNMDKRIAEVTEASIAVGRKMEHDEHETGGKV